MSILTQPDSVHPVIEVTDLWIEIKSNGTWSPIVRGVSFAIRPGEVLGLVGESGAGKTTIGLAALGYLRSGARASSGAVRVGDTDLLSISEDMRRHLRGTRVAYVAQSAQAAFNPAHRLMDQITLVAVARGGMTRDVARKRAIDLFETLQLPEPNIFGDRYPHQVSGGQLQRAMVAMALICNPALIVFDEPTTALDVTTQVEVLIAIRKVIEDFGVSAIYITHDLAVVAQIADRVAVLRYGEIVEEGEINQILNDPQHPYTKSLWSLHEMPLGNSVHAENSLQTLLSIDGISARYGNFAALTDVNLRLDRGTTVALVGESGSGKSTLGRVITGLKEPSEGEIRWDGKLLATRVQRRSLDTLRRIQIIYQSADTALNPRMTIRKIVGRPLKLYRGMRGKAREARIIELLTMVELNESYADRYPGQLSGGQKQRVAIARALAADPELIICDEITSSLDKVVQAEVLRTLLDLQARLGVTYLFITHDIEVVRVIADRVVVMQNGRIVEQGEKTAFFQPPHEPYTEALLASVPGLETGWLDRIMAKRTSQ